ncbi:MAG TPA: immunoglobulin-like domain-containing protein [Solirubrobacterales bacterium]|nr:immunoglobulin-like domain-containing protein [Solirubrobacterales bacterium]
MLGSAATASAMTYEPEPPFCTPQVIEDHLKPLKRLPRLPEPPASGRVRFGPAGLHLQPLPAQVTGEGQVGYKLFLQPNAPSIHPGWKVTTTLARVDWQGRAVETIERTRRRLHTIKAGRGAGVQFEIEGVPGPYRVVSVFRSKTGQRLGEYGFYFQLLPSTNSARLALNGNVYRPGQTVFSRVENLGTEAVRYGVPYSIERLQVGTWEKAPEAPRGPWIMPLLYSAPGRSGPCNGFAVPPTMPSGRYRVVKEVTFGLRKQQQDSVNLYAEFDVVP